MPRTAQGSLKKTRKTLHRQASGRHHTKSPFLHCCAFIMKAETEKRRLAVSTLTGGSARAAEGRGERRRGGGSVRVEEQREKRGGRKSRIKPSRQTDDGTGIKQQKCGIICQMSARHPEEYFRLWRNILLIVFHFLPDFVLDLVPLVLLRPAGTSRRENTHIRSRARAYKQSSARYRGARA